jgi:hypothetical protein
MRSSANNLDLRQLASRCVAAPIGVLRHKGGCKVFWRFSAQTVAGKLRVY